MVPTIALVADPNFIPPADLAAAAAALQIQVLQDIAPAPPHGWGITASVIACPAGGNPGPPGAVPIFITPNVYEPGYYGYHTLQNGQPMAVVQVVPNEPAQWAFYASHELVEMLIDPFGKTMHPSISMDPVPLAQGGRGGAPVSYLLEICDPVQDPHCGYAINGFQMSNFVLPSFFEENGQFPYDRQHVLGKPLSLAQGGIVTWGDPGVNRWFQLAAGQDKVTVGPPLNGPPPQLPDEDARRLERLSPRERVHSDHYFGRHLNVAALDQELLESLNLRRRASLETRHAELEPMLAALRAARVRDDPDPETGAPAS